MYLYHWGPQLAPIIVMKLAFGLMIALILVLIEAKPNPGVSFSEKNSSPAKDSIGELFFEKCLHWLPKM